MQLAAIWIYPLKSLDGVSLVKTEITAGGSLRHDREWALVDSEGNFINGKREPRLHGVRCEFSDDLSHVTLSAEGSARETFDFGDSQTLAAWFSDFLKQSVVLRRNSDAGFPDDLEASGPTVISAATLAALASWFAGLDAEEMRRRLRPNLVLEDCEAFAEDVLFGPPGERVPFTINDVQFLGNNPCQRCVVPTRDSMTGNVTPAFQKQFATLRETTLPPFVSRGRFTHYYRAAVNTIIPRSEAGKTLQVGAQVRH
jgi:uncharacterized protein YcbX